MLLKISSIIALATAAAAHMTFIQPYARYCPDSGCPKPPAGEQVDYDMTTSIGSEGTAVSPICKHTKPYDNPVATWTAGSTVPVKFSPGNGHSGGHCEFSISYDGGKTFVVLKQVLKYCFYSGPANTDTPSVLDFNVELPANLPGSNKAVFAWTWVNASGNREYYMNCADIAIVGGAGSFTGKQMTIANYPGYPTIPEFLGNYNTGIQYYNNGTQVTVSGPGYNGSGGGSTTSTTSTTRTTSSAPAPSTTTTATPPVTTSTTAAPVTTSTTSAPPATTSTSGGGSCSSNTYQCTADKSGYQVCLNGAWSGTQACAAGTVCVQSGTNIYCGWA